MARFPHTIGRHFTQSTLAWVLVLAVCCGGCSRPERPEGLAYVATIPPLTAILEAVAGDRASVHNLLPPGASPHTYEPRPSDAAAAERCLALFFVAPTLDAWAAGLTTPKRLAVMPMIPKAFRIAYIPHRHDDDHGHDHGDVEEDEADPHFWSDPLAVQAMLPALVKAMTALDPQGGRTYQDNAAAFGARLDALHAELTDMLAPFAGEEIILFHPSWVYFLERYGLGVAALVEPAPGKEQSPRYLRRVSEIAREKNVKAIFSEPQLARRPAEVVAETAGLPLFELDPLGGVEGLKDYESLIRHNARVLVQALE